VLSWDGPSRFRPPPTVSAPPECLLEDYPQWEIFGGLRCNAVRREPHGTPQEQRPGVHDVVVADDWDTLRARLVEQAEREAQMA
jgi:hypothetical protein